uniref:Uncharacterized protein n=1 Tax=Acrobeloides nanus TaxID=290746 RepID=A0A914BYT2_9BILA
MASLETSSENRAETSKSPVTTFSNVPSPAPPYFANPFVAPFMPQAQQSATSNVVSGSVPSGNSPSSTPPTNTSPFPGVDHADYRMNPFTGGYYLSPSQYQEMMQQYMQNLMLATAQQQQHQGQQFPGDLSKFPPEMTNGLDSTTLANLTSLNLNSQPSTSHQQHSHQIPPVSATTQSTPSKMSTTSSIGLPSGEPSSTACSSPSPSLGMSTNNRLMTESPILKSDALKKSMTESPKPTPFENMVDETEPSSSQSEEFASNNPNEISHIEKNNNKDEKLALQTSSEGMSIEETPQNLELENSEVLKEEIEGPQFSEKDEETRKDSTASGLENGSGSNSSRSSAIADDSKTSNLIKKQMNEIEKEINRRIQNKNIKKMDENELAQLLSDHGFGSFVDSSTGSIEANNAANQLSALFSANFATGDQAGAPYTQAFLQQEETQPRPSLNQLRSSFSPPESSPPATAFQATAMMGGFLPANMGIPGATSFVPFGYGVQLQPAQPPNQMPMGFSPLNGPMSPFYPAAAVPGQPFQPQMAPMPQMGFQANLQTMQQPAQPGAITPEMAAALLQQLQKHNPDLLQNLVAQATGTPPSQQQPTTSTTPGPTIPPPPSNTAQNHTGKNSITSPTTTTSPWVEENGWNALTKRHSLGSTNSNGSNSNVGENKENSGDQQEPVWVMRETYLKRLEREEQRKKELTAQENGLIGAHEKTNGTLDENDLEETDKLLTKDPNEVVEEAIKSKKSSAGKKEVMVHEPAVLIEGVLFRARYLGSTQMTCDGRQTKSSRMAQAQDAVARVKAPDGEFQPSTEIDLFISTEKIMVLNTDLQDILMDHSLRSISYIADIGDLVVLMARRVPQANGSDDEDESVRKTPKVICHVFESEEAAFIAQSIGQAFQVAYVEFLRANGIDDPAYLREIDYQEVLNAQELMGEELELFARKETQKDVVVPKKCGEPLGIVVVESGWGSMLPTVVIANMAPGGPASRSNMLNIGDQIIAINGISLVGLPLAAAQTNIKNAKSSTAVRLTVVSTPPVVEVRIKRPDTKYQLGFSVQNGVICSLLRGGIAERGGIRVGHRIIEINHQSVVAVPHEKIVNMLATATGEIQMKTMPTSMFRLLTGQEIPNYI